MKRAAQTLAALAALIAAPAFAQHHDSAVIDAGAGANSQGRIAVNQAAGTGNAQANLAALADAQNGFGIADTHSRQQAAPGQRAASSARAAIADGAFGGVDGALSVNQAAGDSNLQLNTLSIGSGGTPVAFADDAALAETATTGTSTEGTATATPDRHATIDLDAFRGSQGVVQVNQTAGVGNLSTNAIVLQLPGSTP